MTDLIFEYKDMDTRIEVRESLADDVYLTVTAVNHCDREKEHRVSATYLPPPLITRLRKALEPYDPGARDQQPAPTTPMPGRVYRLLPDAHHALGRSELNGTGATKVRVDAVTGLGVNVTPLDGTHAGRSDWFGVKAEYLAPLDTTDREALIEQARALLAKSTHVTPTDVIGLAHFLAQGPGPVADRVALVERAQKQLQGLDSISPGDLTSMAHFLAEEG